MMPRQNAWSYAIGWAVMKSERFYAMSKLEMMGDCSSREIYKGTAGEQVKEFERRSAVSQSESTFFDFTCFWIERRGVLSPALLLSQVDDTTRDNTDIACGPAAPR